MSWLRIDDGYLEHPKTADLTDAAVILHLAILLYCARNRTQGEIALRAVRSQRSYRASRLQELVNAELVHIRDRNLLVHDWADWNPHDPAAAQRMERYRARKAGREPSLQAKQHRNTPVTTPVTPPSPEPSPEPSRTRGRNTRTSTELGSSTVAVASNAAVADDDADRAELDGLLTATDWTPRQRQAAREAPGLALAWLFAAAQSPGLERPFGWAWQGFTSGARPQAVREAAPEPPNPSTSLSKVCPDCGETYGFGHQPDCPRMAKAADAAEPEPADPDGEQAANARNLLERVTKST